MAEEINKRVLSNQLSVASERDRKAFYDGKKKQRPPGD